MLPEWETKFTEKAAELVHTVLTNKKIQQTRFVRSLQQGNTAALRNLPTMVSVIAEEYKEAVLERNATKAKELGKTLKGLRDAEVLFSSIGIGQLLEHYCEASLEVHNTSRRRYGGCAILQSLLGEGSTDKGAYPR